MRDLPYPNALRRLAELLALTAFAVAQPVLDVTGRSPDFFLYRRVSPLEIRLLLVAVVLGPPLALWLVEIVVALFNRPASRVLHLVFAGVLFGLIAIQLGKHANVLGGIPLALVGLAAGAGLAVALARAETLRRLVIYATPAPLVFAMLFVLTTPAGALVRFGGEAGAVRAAIPNRPPIVFVFLDEFPEHALLDEYGGIDARLFPSFARLAASSTWYPNATGVSGFTPFAAPAILSGRFPQRQSAPSYVEFPQTMFTLLGGTYDIKAYETISELCPPRLCSGVSAGRSTGLAAALKDTVRVAREIVSPYPSDADPTLSYVEETVDAARAEAGSAEVPINATYRFGELKRNQPERFTSFMAGLERTARHDRPELHFLHLLLPHAPWRYLPSGNVYGGIPPGFIPPPPGKPLHGTVPDDERISALNRQRLLLQLAYTDGLLGDLLARLRGSGLYDDALLIVTADHGTGLLPRAHGRALDEANPVDLAYVPLFVKYPGQRAGVLDRRNVLQVDLLPTIADVLRVTVPWDMDGRSLLGPARPTDEKRWYNTPGVPVDWSGDGWLPRLRHGLAATLVRPERGIRGLYAVGPLGHLVGRRVVDLPVGPPRRSVAALSSRVNVTNVDPSSGRIPAMLFGALDRPQGSTSMWLAASVNGTVAGAVAAVPGGDGQWRFLGVVDDMYFRAGANDIRLYRVENDTLHPLAWEGE